MSIIRSGRKTFYTCMANDIYANKEISFKAKGVLGHLQSLPPDWKIYIEQLSTVSSDGIVAVRSAIDELIKYGYIIKKQLRNGNQFAGYEYIAYDTPQPIENIDNSED